MQYKFEFRLSYFNMFQNSDGAHKSRLMVRGLVRHRDDVIFRGTGPQFHETSYMKMGI